nr:MAG TPA: hypothetical protein [Caudoviricetes sp.]
MNPGKFIWPLNQRRIPKPSAGIPIFALYAVIS